MAQEERSLGTSTLHLPGRAPGARFQPLGELVSAWRTERRALRGGSKGQVAGTGSGELIAVPRVALGLSQTA